MKSMKSVIPHPHSFSPSRALARADGLPESSQVVFLEGGEEKLMGIENHGLHGLHGPGEPTRRARLSRARLASGTRPLVT